MQQWPQPKNVSLSDVRSFLGLANFYRRFVRNYSEIALPLTELTREKTGTGFTWGAEQQQAFEALKHALCSPPVLLVPDQTKPFVLNCDACKHLRPHHLKVAYTSYLEVLAAAMRRPPLPLLNGLQCPHCCAAAGLRCRLRVAHARRRERLERVEQPHRVRAPQHNFLWYNRLS